MTAEVGKGTMASSTSGMAHTDMLPNQIHLTKATIEKLRQDNNKLKEELLLENKFSTKPINPALQHHITRLQDEADVYTRKIELERRRVGELEIRVRGLTGRIGEARVKMGGINAAKENHQTLQKKIKILEARLEQSNIKYNEAITHNKKLREQIDNLRRERLVFDGIYKKLEKELNEKKKEMAKIIETANAAYEAREHAIAEMGQLKTQADKEQAAFEKEWKELTAIIEHDRRSREAQRQSEMEERERKTMELLKAKEKSEITKKKITKGKVHKAIDKVTQHVNMDKVQEYGESFAKIQTATGIQDIDELVHRFIDAEDENFTLFNYVNELNEEIEKLEEQIATIKGEIEGYKATGIAVDNEKKRLMKELNDRLLKTQAKAEQYEKRYDGALKTVTELKNGIWNMFNKFGCKTAAVSEVLGDGGVTDTNILQYLGIVEQRTNEILQLYAAHKQERAEDAEFLHVALGQTVTPQAPATQILVQPPSTTDAEDLLDDGETDADDEKPLTHEALLAHATRTVAKKGDTAIRITHAAPGGATARPAGGKK